MAEERWTIGRLLQWTTEYFRNRGSATPRLDAELLLAHALGCQRIELYTGYDREPDEEARSRFRELVRRRGAGEPVAYLVGYREFFSLPFRVTPAVLIPRPETELLVTTLLDLAKTFPAEKVVEVCDVGTGSGVIAVCVAKHLPSARVTAIDICDEALNVARENAELHGVVDRIEFVQSDLLTGLPQNRRFDFIVSNPPYVREDELGELPTDVRDYEPRIALLAGQRGTEVIESLLPQAVAHLNPGGWLLLEINPRVAEEVKNLITNQPELEFVDIRKDLARLPRVAMAQRKGNRMVTSQGDTLSCGGTIE